MTQITAKWLSNPKTKAVCDLLSDDGGSVFFVGGCVRNALLGAPVQDIDLSTNLKPQDVMKRAKDAGLKAIPTGIEHGTVTVVSGGLAHEITTFRKDVQTDGRRAVVAFSDNIADDARRRDFTMNALYAKPNGEIVDPLGGLTDLQARRIRFIENAADRIEEDYLRSLRFFRFFAWYADQSEGFDPEALAGISSHLDGLKTLSAERVGSEICKLLSAPDPSMAVAGMRSTGVLATVLPGTDDLALSRLVHLEQEHRVAPSWVRRLSVLGGENPGDTLRLRKSDTVALGKLRGALETGFSPAEFGYRNGEAAVVDAILIQSALLEMPVQIDDLRLGKMGASAVFPVAARDLMDTHQGPALGARLKELETKWIASGFQATKSDLLM